METIREIECTTGRDNEQPLSQTFPETTVIEDIVNPVTTTNDNQSSTECDIGQAKCLLSETKPSNCNFDSDNVNLETKKALKIFPTFNKTMLLKYSKELLGFFALILTTYATLLNKESVIGGTTSPKPIFLRDSIVQEWPHGNLEAVQSKVAMSELSLIYFYAPWCAESLHAKKVYSSVASVYSEEVYFAAVNCWQPNSGCRTLYSNVYKWPVLMAYLPNALSVQYNGDWNIHSLSKFIDGLLTPIVRVHNTKELLNLRIANDGVVFGIFNSCDTREFQIFFQTALKWLENNYYEYTKFAVFVGRDTSMFLSSESKQAPVIKLFTTNETIIYSHTKWTTKTIINFVKNHLADSSIWVNLPNAKSSVLQKHVQRGPVLMMISPRVSLNNHYFIMKQLIYTFNPNYYPNDLNSTVLNEYAADMKQKYPTMLQKLKTFCEMSKRLQRQGIGTPLLGVELWSNDVLFSGLAASTNMSKQTSSLFNQYIDVDYCERDLHENLCMGNIDSVDSRSAPEILKRFMQKQCVILENVPRKYIDKGAVEKIELPKHEYKYNKTLKFLMLDSMVHHEYIRHLIGELGSQELSTFSSPQLFIIDNDRETLHIQKTPISTKTTLAFVNDFYQGKLNRHLKSSKRSEIKNNTSASDGLLIKIKELNSRQFAKIINPSNITSVVLFYTPQCALCNIMSRTLLQVSHLINVKSVKFYRINASANDVCWEYTMDKYPTLIIFPQNRSSETNVYLSSLPISVKNVFSFILLNLNTEQRLNALINACMATKLSLAFQNCVSQVRGLIDNEISHQLQRWEEPSTNRTCLLTRLKELKTIYLQLLRARKTEDLTSVSKEIIKYGNLRYH